jgi:hypothetical protein
MRLLLRPIVACALLLACTAPDAQDTPLALLDGIACERCQREPGMPCDAMAIQRVVAEVSGAEPAQEEISCTIDEPAPDEVSECVSTRTWRFGSLRYLRGAPPAAAGDLFQTATRYDYFKPERKRGIVLRADTRYLLFASTAHSDSRPRASWRLAFACEMPPKK